MRAGNDHGLDCEGKRENLRTKLAIDVLSPYPVVMLCEVEINLS